MKKIITLIACSVILFYSCQSEQESTKEDAVEAINTEEASSAEVEEEKLTGDELIAKKDPVCLMDVDAAWTDSAVYEGKTVHFCSETCKAAFEADEEKYLK